jgi:putative copper resistance protein D
MPTAAISFFDLGEGGMPLALVRGLAVAAMFSAFGSLLFLTMVAPPVLANLVAPHGAIATRRCVRLVGLSLAFAILGDFVWLVLESASMAEVNILPGTIRVVPTVVFGTLFGHIISAQILLLTAALLTLFWTLREALLQAAAGLAGLATVLQAWHLHGAAMHRGLSPLLVSEVLHVLAAGAWLGSLLPLALLVHASTAQDAAVVSRRFSRLGTGCVLVLAATALWQGLALVGGLHGLFGTAYGWMVLVKTALFVVLLAFAWRNRFRLTPALSSNPGPAKRDLVRSIMHESGVGLVIVLVASVLASLAPGMDMSVEASAVQPRLSPANSVSGPPAATGTGKHYADHR